MSTWKLTPFELHMLQDDLRCRSMTILIRLEFSGRLDPDCFAKAVQLALLNHPLLCAHLTGDSRTTFRWSPAADPRPYLDVADRDVPCSFPGRPSFDLTCETGLRIWVRYDADSARILFQFHHACCDGVGAARAMEDMLCEYDRLVLGQKSQAETRAIEVGDLTRRAQFGAGAETRAFRLRRNLGVVPWRVSRFFLESPSQIHCPIGVDPLPAEAAGPLDFPSYDFTRAETTLLQKHAKKHHASTNDLLLRELFLTLRNWNSQHTPVAPEALFRVMVPVSLRTQDHDRSPAANIVSMVSIARRAHQLQDATGMLRGISQEFAFIRDWRIDRALNETVAFMQSIPMLTTAVLHRGQKCQASTVLSNAGKILARALLPRVSGKVTVGGLTLQAVAGVPPVRPKTPVTFGCHWYAGKLGLAMNYDRGTIRAPDAEALFAQYVARIKSFRSDKSDDRESECDVYAAVA